MTAVRSAARVVRHRGIDGLQNALLLMPTVVVTVVFVYGFIGLTVWISVSDWRGPHFSLALSEPILQAYVEMFQMPRFFASIRNVTVFGIAMVFTCTTTGLLLSVLLFQHKHRLIGALRSIVLAPYALSFVVTGVVWRWIFNPQQGLSTLLPFNVDWIASADVLGDLSFVAWLLPDWSAAERISWGVPEALLLVIVAAWWQLSGFATAIVLAGLASLDENVVEAARMDGCGTWRLLRHVYIPLLRPFMVVAAVILTHLSLKVFDLVYVMTGAGANFATDVPGIFVYEQGFGAERYNVAAAMSVVMLIMVVVVVAAALWSDRDR